MITAIVNGRIVLEDKILADRVLLMENGRILSVEEKTAPEGAEVIDAAGGYVGPGYVDIHTHGGGSHTSHGEPLEMAEYHLQYGTTSICPSLAYELTKEEMLQGIRNIRQAMKQGGNSVAGIHLEGPYTSKKYGAAAAKAWELNREDYELLFREAAGCVRQVTHAPEIPGIEEFEEYVEKLQIPQSVGHTEMSPEELKRAMSHGATIVTHLFDAMGCWRGNDSIAVTGVIQETAAEVALAQEGLYYELICDSAGMHVKPANLRLTLRAAGAENIILITDANIGQYRLEELSEDDMRRRYPDLNFNSDGELSGSRLTMELAVKNMRRHTGATVRELFLMAAANPARAVGLYEQTGSLAAGKWSDILICDSELKVEQVFLHGKPVRREAVC